MSDRSVAAVFRQAVGHALDGRVVLPRDFQGFPGTVHGGGAAALFLHAAGLEPSRPVRLVLKLLRAIPVEVPLHLVREEDPEGIRLALHQGDRPLAEGVVSEGAGAPSDSSRLLAAWRASRTPAGQLPGTATCLACGSANPLGLQLRLEYNDRFIWREFEPRALYQSPEGLPEPALAPIVLDEIGWWLGALGQGECGVTNELTIALLGSLPRGPLLVLGDRGSIRLEDDPRGRYCRAEAVLLTRSGEPLAAAAVRFAGSRAYSKRLLPALIAESGDAIYRLFPHYAPKS